MEFDHMPAPLGNLTKREKLVGIARGREPKFPNGEKFRNARNIVRLMQLNPCLRPWLSMDEIWAMGESEQWALLDKWRHELKEHYTYQFSLTDEELKAYWIEQAKELDRIVAQWEK